MTDYLDPLAMISPPFKTCPACGNAEFGVHLISGFRYMRRCRDCWHNSYFPLPQVQKKIIYLDQFVVSNLMKLENPSLQRNDKLAKDSFWTELRNSLLQLREFQLICCPNSGSHEAESRISPFNDELKKTYEALSGGIKFISFEGIESKQVGELGRAWSDAREPEFNFNPKHVLTRDPNEWSERFYIVFGNNPFSIPEEIRQARGAIEAHITRLFRDVWAKEKRSFHYWYELERREYQGHLRNAITKSQIERFKAVLEYRPGVEIPVEALGRTLLSHAEVMLIGLERTMKFSHSGGERTREERDKLEQGFAAANRIAEAPFVKLQAMMFAALAMRAAGGQKEFPNEGTNTDIETVAHLLPYCDAMFMDNGCRSLLLDIPQDVRPPEVSRVFSPKSRDEFLTYLRSIREGITAEQVAALRDVYGYEYL